MGIFSMYINAVGHYLPQQVVDNAYFKELTGFSPDWLLDRTGIEERRRASPGENTNTMGVESVRAAASKLPYAVTEVDLVIGATYTPYDTVVTLAHFVQHAFNIENAQVVTVASACSSFLNALEIVQGYFAMGKASRALIVASEHNSAYNDETDVQSGHLWGDGASAIFVSKEKYSETDFTIVDLITKGLGHVGRSVESVYLRPLNGGLKMPFGKDVFLHANNYMISTLETLLTRNSLTIGDIAYLIPHQANMRIIKYTQNTFNLPDEKVLINIHLIGNTGCASTFIALSQNLHLFRKGDLIAFTVFGGGYSSGAMLLRK